MNVCGLSCFHLRTQLKGEKGKKPYIPFLLLPTLLVSCDEIPVDWEGSIVVAILDCIGLFIRRAINKI